ncbi:MFS transporter, partial [Alcanivorax sp. 1008]|uniref:MFS transporter n=1 Tax=Alcanivorax sp. 1008 TaxID=2816853 RepID=UPI001E30A487
MIADSRQSPIPYYWRLSSFYLFYFALLGMLVPYWGLYLQTRGFAAAQIGLLMAIPQITKLGAPNLWGWLADRTGQRLRIIRAGNLLAAIIFTGVFVADGFWSMVIVLAGFSFFWNAVLAQFEVITLDTLGERSHRYSQVRLWGSVGFIAAVLVVGVLLDLLSVSLLPWLLCGGLWLIWLCTLFLPAGSAPLQRVREGKLLAVLRQPGVPAFFACAFLMQLSHGPYYTFYTIHLVDMGISRTVAGSLWALGVIAEVGLFLIMHWLLVRVPLKVIVTVSLLLAALRWLLIGSVGDNLAWLALGQLLHAATFGSFHAAAMAWLHRTFSGGHAGQGQALYSSFGFGAGWAVGAGLSGMLWTSFGSDSFLLAAAVA